MKKVAVLASVLAFASAASADTFKVGKQNRENVVVIQGSKLGTTRGIQGPAEDIINIMHKGGAMIAKRIPPIYMGRDISGVNEMKGTNLVSNVTIQFGAKKNAQIDVTEGASEVPYLVLKGDAANELMDFMRKAGYAYRGPVGESRTQTRFVSCSAAVVAKPKATCVIMAE